jgi:phosphoglycolate phosphatase
MDKPDSIIFDMDGTLWDAVDMYVASWNEGYKLENIDKTITRKDIDFMMGWEKRKVLDHMLPEYDVGTQEKVYETINRRRSELVTKIGGTLYPGVKEGLFKLSKKYSLFIVSNCPKNLIIQFMRWANISHLITDEMAFGINNMPKHHNIRLIVEKHHLQHPIYVGDTHIDSIESRKAGLPFIFIEGGFGTTTVYDLKFGSFTQFTDYFIDL